MGDVGVAVCCGACGLCQTAVEVQERGDHQWWYGELSKWSLQKDGKFLFDLLNSTSLQYFLITAIFVKKC